MCEDKQKLKEAFKRGFIEKVSEMGIGKFELADTIVALDDSGYMEKEALLDKLVEGVLKLAPWTAGVLWKGLPLAAGAGATVGLLSAFRKNRRLKNKYMKRKVVDERLDRMIEKIDKMQKGGMSGKLGL